MALWLGRLSARFYYRFRPFEGWGAIVAVLAGVTALAGAVEQAAWLRTLPGAFFPSLTGALSGIILAKKMPHRRLAGLALFVIGLALGVISIARAWPPGGLVASNLRYLLANLGIGQSPPAIIPLLPWTGERLAAFGQALSEFVRAGQGFRGPGAQVLALLYFLILWGATAWGGWAVFRRRQALPALLPAGVLLAINTFFAQVELFWLPLYLFGLVLLSLRLRQATLEAQWEARDIPYSPEFRLDLYFSGFALTTVIAALLFLTPNPKLGFVASAFWRVFSDPYVALETSIKQVFPELDRTPRSLVGGGLAGGGGLPRAHLLGGNPELQKRQIMVVRLAEDATTRARMQANIRWRGVTFSEYTGQGWDNPETIWVERFGPGEVWLPTLPAGRRTVRQDVRFSEETPFWLYALGDPIAADRPYVAHLRSESDAVGLDVRAREYTVVSRVPNVSEADLRGVRPPKDPALAPYLALPDTVPPRVRALAQKIAGAEPTAYDQAKALETFLRSYAYSLEVPEPPAGVDVADYFLFDLQKGYCDYYATAMVVMARSLGLPTRLAIGYAAGDYDEEEQRYTVVEADAHSWPEIYFGDYGWIPFEPTAAQPVYVREPIREGATEAEATNDLRNELQILQRRAWWAYGYWRWGLLLFGSVLALAGFWWLRGEWRLRREAQNPWQLAYLRLESWGERLGAPPAPWYTPAEYAALWRARLDEWAEGHVQAYIAGREIERLVQALEQRAYALPTHHPSDSQAHRLWRQLRGALWRLRVAAWFARPFTPSGKDPTKPHLKPDRD